MQSKYQITLTQHVDRTHGVCFNGLDRIVHVMRGRRRRCQVIDLINWQQIKCIIKCYRVNR